jgi:hypothetical protein
MEPKSRRHIFVGYDDGSKAIKYYNAETRKVLTSRNIHFLDLSHNEPSPEPMVLLPDAPCEGESEGAQGGTQLTSVNKSDSLKRKQDQNEDGEMNDRRTRAKHVDYRYLNDPFPDEEKNNESEVVYTADDEIYAIIAGDEYTSLKDARNSPDWPEWEKAIHSELAQLTQMGTWRLVEKPPQHHSDGQ